MLTPVTSAVGTTSTSAIGGSDIGSFMHPGTPNPDFGDEQVRIRLFHRSQIRRCELLLADSLKSAAYWGTRLASSQTTLARLLREDESLTLA
jgi:hypothetical protein